MSSGSDQNPHAGKTSHSLDEEMWNRCRVGARQCSQSCSRCCRRTDPGQLVGASKGEGNIPALTSDSTIARRFGVPAGGWENYLRSSADMARPRFIGRTIFQAAAFGRERSAYTCGQAQALGHSISRLGAQRSPASRAETHRERGRFTIGARFVTIELNVRPPPNAGIRLFQFSLQCHTRPLRSIFSKKKFRMFRLRALTCRPGEADLQRFFPAD